MNLKSLNLKYNPFKDLTPDLSNENLIWGGMDEVKAKIEKCYSDCIQNNSKQIVLNWGPYGGGKTFSAYYFQQKFDHTANLTHLYLRSPKDGAKAVDDLFKSVIDKLTFEAIREQIQNILKTHDENALIDYLAPRATREFAKAILLIGSDDEEVASIMNRFLYTGITLTELKKLGLAKKIQTDTDRVKFLAGIVSCFIGNSKLYDGRVVIWLDEMEDLIYYSPKNYKTFSQALRDLFDSISDRLLLFMNFTLAEGQEATIELILGGALWSRITRKIRFKEFEQADALKYCNDLLSEAKIRKTITNPFTQTIITEVINSISIDDLTPRQINKQITSLMTYAIENNFDQINQDVFNEWITELSEENL